MTGRHRRRPRRLWFPVLAAVAVVTLGAAVYGTVVLSSAPAPLPAGDGAQPGVVDRIVRVTAVVDGDSFVIDGGTVVRVLAADACEMRTDAGPAARADAAAVLDGRTVTLRREPTGRDDADRDGRLLRYVEVPGLGDLGSYLVQRPHTAVYTGFNDASAEYADRLRALDRDGRRCMRDLPAVGNPGPAWADCAAVRATGLSALYANDPGYRRDLDGNDDGVACE